MKKAFTLIELLVIIAIVAILVALGCKWLFKTGKGQPVPVQLPTGTNLESAKPPASAGYDVQLLFMINGLRIYRFYDNGHYVYVADGRDSKTTWNDSTMVGKVVVEVPKEVQTVK